jgi:hypothetical protein
VVNSLIGSALVYTLLGLDLHAGAIYTLATALGEFFYHTNVKTPRWIGWFFQRPEMHRIHHQVNRHKNNYGDIVWWDMLFGTYENPKDFASSCGFTDHGEERLSEMLACKDIHLTKKAAGAGLAKTSAVAAAATLATLLASCVSPCKARACSVFAAQDSQQQFFVGKNFDWLPSRGFIIENPTGRIRHSFYDGSMTWTSRYSSKSMTTLGPGLPISSMNEKGLVVETLVDFDSKMSETPKNHLISLEWAQYVLDNFVSLDEVIHFARQNAFDQVIESVHFFICDAGSHCAVFETSDAGLKITTGLNPTLLANRDYEVDRTHSQNGALVFFGLVWPHANSSRRFHRLDLATTGQTLSSTQQIFSALDRSKIGFLIQWQNIWQPEQMQLTWRTFFHGQPGTAKSLPVEPVKSCQAATFYHDLQNPQIRRAYNQNDMEAVRSHIAEVMFWRDGRRDKQMADRIANYTLQSECGEN